MSTEYIKFSTQTAGEQARRLLQRNGINCILRRNPKPDHKEGCSYALFVRGSTKQAVRLIANAHISHLGMESLRDGR